MDDFSLIILMFFFAGVLLIVSAALLIYAVVLALELKRKLRRVQECFWIRQRDLNGRPYRERF